jgi:sugar phosphate permease
MNIPISDLAAAEIGQTRPGPTGSPGGGRGREQLVALASMYFGYAMFMVLRTIPSVAGAAIREDPSLHVDLEVWGKIVACGAWGAVVGKILCGYAADKVGGKRTFAVGLLVASLFVGLFGFVSDARAFGAAFFLVLMAKSAGWPSMARIIINWFQPHQYGRVWGILSTSSRVGTLAATFCLSSLLAWMSWRGMLWIAAGLGTVTAIAFAFLMQERPAAIASSVDETRLESATSPSPPHPLDGTTLVQAILCFLRSGQFWLIAGGLMGLAILWDFLLIVPMFLQDTLHLTAAAASRAASAFPLGSLISVLIGGYVFDKLSRRATAWVMGLLLTFASGCLLTFLMMPHFELTTGALIWLSLGLLFVFGLCVSPCYYIPMSVFSIEFGGPHAGFLIALLDALSFIATAIFYYYGGGLAEQSWSLFLKILLAVSIWSALATFVFLQGEARRRRGNNS